MKERERARLRATLMDKWRELTHHESPFEEMRTAAEPDPFDQLRGAADRDVSAEVLSHESDLGHDVRDALRKIDSTGYGICEGCAQPIHAQRLEAAPWVRLCYPCQDELEHPERQEEEIEQVA
jgi:RNA polymerase-binding transcription factor DksA